MKEKYIPEQRSRENIYVSGLGELGVEYSKEGIHRLGNEHFMPPQRQVKHEARTDTHVFLVDIGMGESGSLLSRILSPVFAESEE